MTTFTRRGVLAGAAALAAGCAADRGSAPVRGVSAQWSMPAESVPHARTYLGWPSARIWGRDAAAVRRDIAGIAQAVAGHEPVVLLAEPGQVKAAQRACGAAVEVVPIPVDDLWTRDTGPTFVTGSAGLAGVDFNFNGWGGKQEDGNDSLVARRILERGNLRRIQAPIVAEGGSLEVDGAGTLMATESSLVNANRNPGKSRADIEAVLEDLLGVRKVIWFKGVKGEDITDCHVDALARFADPGVVVLNKPAPGTPPVWQKVYEEAREVLRTATDARGKRLEVVELPEPADYGDRGPDFLPCYVNYYVANGAVLIPRFGDRTADQRAAGIVRDLHPGRTVVQLKIDMLAEGGGGIHCATQQQPRV